MNQKNKSTKTSNKLNYKINEKFQPMISKTDFIPCYLQLKNILKEQIQSGVITGAIPSERELAERFHLNRATIRHTLSELVKEGLILKRKGQSTVIVPFHHLERDYAHELISFTEEMHRKGLTPSSKVLCFKKIPANRNLSTKLNIPIGSEVVVLERIRYGNSQPFNLGISFLPFSLCPTIFEYDFNHESLHQVLKSAYGLDLVMSHESFEPVLPTEEEAKILEIPVCSPLLLMEGITFAADGRLVEYFQLKFRGDKAKFTVKVFKNRETYTI